MLLSTSVDCCRSLARVAGTAAIGVVSLASLARAHEVFPTQLDLRPGSRGFIYVIDKTVPTLCAATITAASQSANVTVCAVDMNSVDFSELLPGCVATVPGRIDQVYRVTIASDAPAESATVNISWIGADFPNPPCDENNTGSPVPVTVNIHPDPMASGATLSAATVSDPIVAASGAYTKKEALDIDLGGPLPVSIGRVYDSMLQADGNYISALGPNWLHTYDWFANISDTTVEISTNTGRVVRFKQDFSSTEWDLEVYQDVPFQLVESGGDFVLGDIATGAMYTFDASTGLLTAIEDGKGNRLTLTYSMGLLATVSDGLGRTLTFSYTMGNLLQSVSDGTRMTEFTYVGGILATAEDALNRVTTYTYDPMQPGEALMTSCTRPEGNVHFVQTYDMSKRATSQADPDTNTTTLSYDTPGQGDTTVLDPLGNTRVFTHSPDAELTAFTDEDMQSGALGYDGAGRRTSITDRLGAATSWTFDPVSGLLASYTTASGGTTTFTRAPRVLANGLRFHDLVGVAYPDGSSESFTYDASGNVLTWTSRRNHTWSFTYNARGQALTVETPTAGTYTYTYNADGTPATVTDNASKVTTFGYDGLRRLDRITYADSEEETFTYDAMDRVTGRVDANSRAWAVTYDDNDNLTRLDGPLASSVTLGYDGLDRLTSITNSLSQAVTTTYDELGRVRTILDANGNGTTSSYDERGNRTSIADGENRTWTRTFDAEGVLETEVNPLGQVTAYATNAMGRITRVTGHLGNQSSMTYDAMNRLRTVSDGSGSATTFTYDAEGYVTRAALPAAGVNVTYTRNGLGQIVGINDLAGEDWTFTCDPVGRLVSRADPLGSQHTYEYDTRGRLMRITYPGAMGTQVLAYDAVGRLTGRTWSDGTSATYAYDALDRLESTDGASFGYDAGHRLTSSNGIAVTRDPAGRIVTMTLAPGLVVTYAYDDRNLCTGITDSMGGSTTFTYDDAGRVLTQTHDNGLVTSHAWDAEGRIERVTHGSLADITLVHDGAGRVTQATRMVPETGLPVIGDLDLTVGSAGQVVAFSYDERGSRTDDGQRSYSWNLAQQLEDYTEKMTTVSFTYDGLGMPVSRTEGGATRELVWNYALPLPSVSVERDMGADVRYYVAAPGGALLYSIDAGTGARHMYHYDECGNTLFLSDETQAVTDSYAYDPFGNKLSETVSTDNVYTWQGRYGVREESGSGLYSARSRWYDARTLSFVTRDPVVSPSPWLQNPYQYGHGDPLTYIDPLGASPRRCVSQVLVDTKLVTISRNHIAEFGINWQPATNLPDMPSSSTVAVRLSTATDPVFGTASLDSQTALLGFLASAAGTQVVAAPKLVALDDSEATIFVGDSVRYADSTTASTRESPTIGGDARSGSPPDPGFQLLVVPHVVPGANRISMAIVPRTPGADTLTHRKLVAKWRRYRGLRDLDEFPPPGGGSIGLPQVRSSRVATSVLLGSGQTAVLGGLVTQRDVLEDNALPFLGEVPLLGELFRQDRENSQRRNLLLFVTPTILDMQP